MEISQTVQVLINFLYKKETKWIFCELTDLE